MILSSETEQMTQGSLGFHEKSEILAVCPPWMNSSSGGPSSASSAVCSSPIFDKSHTCSLMRLQIITDSCDISNHHQLVYVPLLSTDLCPNAPLGNHTYVFEKILWTIFDFWVSPLCYFSLLKQVITKKLNSTSNPGHPRSNKAVIVLRF